VTDVARAPGAASPSISVVVPTRNRAQHARDCARAILETSGFIELIVVDQSDGPETRLALETIADERLQYVHSTLRGATNGRNVGIEKSRGDIVAFTDDDCRIDADWALRIAEAFRASPETAVVCGRVTVPEEIQRQGFAVGFEPVVREWQNRFPAPGVDWGITANFAVKRSVFDQVGPFDPMLGPGAPLLCGEEPDLLFRVLRAGLKVVNAREVHVQHFGVRAPGEETRALFDTYAAGTAAALIKHARLLDPQGAALYARWLAKSGTRVVKSVLTGTRPTGARFLKAFVSGTLASWKFKIDPDRRIYEKR
jgi:glycosyltransferase involved in cell wall biosynthesis